MKWNIYIISLSIGSNLLYAQDQISSDYKNNKNIAIRYIQECISTIDEIHNNHSLSSLSRKEKIKFYHLLRSLKSPYYQMKEILSAVQ